jgi:hypothetical protein
MKSPRQLPTYIFLWVIALLAVATLMIVASPRLRNAGKQQEDGQTAQLPKIISKVKDLEVISITLDERDAATPTLVIEIRNNSVKPIVAISVESGDEKDSSGIGTDGFIDGDKPPYIILPPQGTITMRMPVASLLPGKPVKVSAVMYADGTDDGEDRAKETIRIDKQRAKDRASERKGEPQQ